MPQSVTTFELIFSVFAVTLAISAYVRWVQLLKVRGGKVETAHFQPTDLVVTVALGIFLIWAGAVSLTMIEQKAAKIDMQVLAYTSIAELIALGLLCGFLAVRRISLKAITGVTKLSWPRVIGYAVLFLALAFPLVAVAAGLLRAFAPGEEEQMIVSYARQQAATGAFQPVALIFASAALVAPLVEEFLFRGYLYPAMKRYIGPVAAALIAAALFALAHANVAALAPLFVLALCLTVAFEWTGSLVVPFAMHLLFNTLNLAAMIAQAKQVAAA